MNEKRIKKGTSILLTIDVEDWFQVENLRPWVSPECWSEKELRVEKNTNELLDLLDSAQMINNNGATPKATFFILGWIAKRLPDLVREISRRGHEVASHGYGHLMCTQLSEQELKEDLIRSKKSLEDLLGVEVRGYRAPNFSINDTALQLVRATGYRYDSSYNNFSKHGRYGTISINKKAEKNATILLYEDFVELPISNLAFGKLIIPWGGGGYFRFFPLFLFKLGVSASLRKTDAYLFYMHPWEIDPNQPRIRQVKGLTAWRHYLNLHKTKERLKNFLISFKHCNYITCSQYLNDLELIKNES